MKQEKETKMTRHESDGHDEKYEIYPFHRHFQIPQNCITLNYSFDNRPSRNKNEKKKKKLRKESHQFKK
jgi:hypothetical protein